MLISGIQEVSALYVPLPTLPS